MSYLIDFYFLFKMYFFFQFFIVLDYIIPTTWRWPVLPGIKTVHSVRFPVEMGPSLLDKMWLLVKWARIVNTLIGISKEAIHPTVKVEITRYVKCCDIFCCKYSMYISIRNMVKSKHLVHCSFFWNQSIVKTSFFFDLQ